MDSFICKIFGSMIHLITGSGSHDDLPLEVLQNNAEEMLDNTGDHVTKVVAL